MRAAGVEGEFEQRRLGGEGGGGKAQRAERSRARAQANGLAAGEARTIHQWLRTQHGRDRSVSRP